MLGYYLEISCTKFQRNRLRIDGKINEKHALQIIVLKTIIVDMLLTWCAVILCLSMCSRLRVESCWSCIIVDNYVTYRMCDDTLPEHVFTTQVRVMLIMYNCWYLCYLQDVRWYSAWACVHVSGCSHTDHLQVRNGSRGREASGV